MPLPFIIAGLAAIGSSIAVPAATVAGAIGLGALGFGGLCWIIGSALEEGKTEGLKEGYAKASREYERKFNNQALAFEKKLRESEQKYGSILEISDSVKKELSRELGLILGRYQGLLARYEEEQTIPLKDTKRLYKEFASLYDQLSA